MKEEALHKQICTFLKLQYPELIFTTDLSGIKLTKGQAKKLKSLRSGRGMPDIMIFEPRGEFKGFFAEIKRESPYKKNGELKKCEHLKEQQHMINRLIMKGYYADFFWDFEHFRGEFMSYMLLK